MTELIHKELSFAIIGAAMEVHRILGPGFLEAVYQTALAYEFTLRGISNQQQTQLPVHYKGVRAGTYLADFLVEEKVVVEIKAVSQLNDSHKAQAIHYLAATGYQLALLLNFGAASLQTKRVIR